MTTAQKVIKYIALALAVCLIVGIISGIIRLAGGLSYIFSRNEPNSDLTNEYTDISDAEHISILDIELEYAQLIIKNGDGFKVETSDKEITVKFDKKNSKLTIKEPDRMFHSTKGETVILYIPENSEFESVEIDSGAGTVEVEALSVNDLTLDLGAGKAEFNELFVTRAADIDCGTGATTIGNGEIRNLDIDIGVGKIEITSKLTGNCFIDNGIGSAEIKILNSKEAYTIKTSSGIGTVLIDGQSVSKDTTIGSGENLIKISGGIGTVNISFN